MKKLFSLMTFAVMLVLLSSESKAQVVYTEVANVDSVRVAYRWQRERFFASDSHAVLNLQMTNESEESVKVSFVAAFYRGGIMVFETAEQEICLKPGETKRGHRAGLRFMAEGITMLTVEQEDFSWDIPFMDVVPVPVCK